MCGSWRKVPSNKDVPDAHCAISILDKTVNKYFKFLAVVCTLVLTASTASYAKGGGGGGGGSGGGAGSGSAGTPTGAGAGATQPGTSKGR
jgi:uncharacterized membrane protein